MNDQPTSNRSQWERFTQKLLTTTCLGVAASAAAHANAIIIVEGTVPAPSDFPNSTPGYLLPIGTNVVQGQLHATTDLSDWFEFQGLAAGRSFAIISTYNPLHQERGVSFQVFNSLGSQLGSETLEGPGGLVAGTIPNDGELLVDMHYNQSGNPTYQVNLTAEIGQAPEPALGWGTGLALAAGLTWKRKKRLQA